VYEVHSTMAEKLIKSGKAKKATEPSKAKE
jgi:hypothetical protein